MKCKCANKAEYKINYKEYLCESCYIQAMLNDEVEKASRL